MRHFNEMKFSQEVKLKDLWKLKEIEFLTSHREGRLAQLSVNITGNLVFGESPLGKTVGRANPALFEKAEVAAHESKIHLLAP